ncbi:MULTISPECIES: glycosyltransferase [unclassified Micromonospora]|uniref:glycosyltransferase n=1 Tax=unclassified Micromonospora TaxID=2617518 RepID=UPI002FEFE056
MTVLNEASSLPSFLAQLGRQSVLPDEIVIVDGGSDDGTLDLLESWVPPSGVTLNVFTRPGANISQGRNAAIAAAANEAILVTDGGTLLTDRWVELLWQALNGGADVAAGFFEPHGETRFQTVLAHVITPKLSEIRPATFLPSSRSVGFWRHRWREAGGYPEWLDYCEDLVLDLELKRLGAKFVFVPDAVAAWDARADLRSFAKQYYRYARGDGKAGLWPKRHAIRYGVYCGVVILIPTVGVWSVPIVLVGAVAYLQKYVRRLTSGRTLPGPEWLKALCLVPVIVVTGDVAKMAGYPAGRVWRLRKRQGR